MEYTSIIIPFIGGLGMFIYGMQIMAQGLENAAGNRMKSMLGALTRNKFFGVLLGAAVTAIIQSSSATTVMVVGFVNAGIMNLTQAMGVIMGANIGTTVTGWLVSSVEWAKFLSPAMLAPIAVMLGVIIMMTGKRHSTKDISSIIIGFGLLFVGISTMSSAVSPLQESEGLRSLFVNLGGNPLLGIAVGALVTAIIQSSSASVGILQSLAFAGLVPFGAAIYIIMGQNIGTCVTAILSAMGAKKNAKTAALMHLLFNIIGTIIFSIGVIAYMEIVRPVWANGTITQTQISMIHTIFNVVTTILLFPVSDLIVKLAKKIGGVTEEGQDENSLLLDERMMETPGIAIPSMLSEITRMGRMVQGALEITKTVFETRDEEAIRELRKTEKTVDVMSKGLTDYSIQLSALQISEREHQEVSHMIQVVSDIERVSDYCENIAEFVEALIEKKIDFSETGHKHLQQMIEVCTEAYVSAIDAFEHQDSGSALHTIEKETEADGLEISYRNKHTKRLVEGVCDAEAGVIFLDALICMERVSDHARNIAEEVLEEKGQL